MEGREKPLLVFIYGAAFGAALATIVAVLLFALRPDRTRVHLQRQLIEAERPRTLAPIPRVDSGGRKGVLDPQGPALYYFHLEGCSACARAEKALGRWLGRKPDVALVVIALPRGGEISQELKEAMREGPWRNHPRVEIYFDPNRETPGSWGVKAFPTFLAVRDRRVLGQIEGFPEGDLSLASLLDRLVETLDTGDGKGGEEG